VKIGVCAKVTPDTDTRIKINGTASGIDPAGVKWIVNPYDAFAIEEGVRTQEKNGGSVEIFTVGDKEAETLLRGATGLALGPDGMTLFDPAGAKLDSLGIARVLAAMAKKSGAELLFCGKQAIDDDNVQVPAMLAEILGWAHIAIVTEFAVDGDSVVATRNIGGGIQEVVRAKLPAVITVDKGINTPRYAKLPQIMAAKKKPFTAVKAGDLGLSDAELAPVVETSAWTEPPARAKGRKLSGDAASQVKELVRLLREEAKVI
jgi:electron transfer flavoprotein beta subunit